MTTPRIEFHSAFPQELTFAVDALLEENKWICPLWLQHIKVEWQPEAEYAMQWTLEKDYRFACLSVSTGFLDSPDWQRRELIIHEMVHSFTIPLKTAALDAMHDCEIENPVYAVIVRQIDRVMEQVTQDFAYAIARK